MRIHSHNNEKEHQSHTSIDVNQQITRRHVWPILYHTIQHDAKQRTRACANGEGGGRGIRYSSCIVNTSAVDVCFNRRRP